MNNFFRPFTLLILTPFSFFPLTLRKLRSPWHYLSIFLLSSPSLLPPSFSPSVSSPFVAYALDFSPPFLTPLSSLPLITSSPHPIVAESLWLSMVYVDLVYMEPVRMTSPLHHYYITITSPLHHWITYRAHVTRHIVSCPAGTFLPARNRLVNKVEISCAYSQNVVRTNQIAILLIITYHFPCSI